MTKRGTMLDSRVKLLFDAAIAAYKIAIAAPDDDDLYQFALAAQADAETHWQQIASRYGNHPSAQRITAYEQYGGGKLMREKYRLTCVREQAQKAQKG